MDVTRRGVSDSRNRTRDTIAVAANAPDAALKYTRSPTSTTPNGAARVRPNRISIVFVPARIGSMYRRWTMATCGMVVYRFVSLSMMPLVLRPGTISTSSTRPPHVSTRSAPTTSTRE